MQKTTDSKGCLKFPKHTQRRRKLRSKRTRATDISEEVRQIVHKRDKGCIFCQKNFRMPPEDEFTTTLGTPQIMHFIPRSQGGLGIPENLADGCVWHHMLLDNGRDSRTEMMQVFEDYLRSHYPGWNKEKLTYNKWDFFKEGKDVHRDTDFKTTD